jgi:hypothetical protein
MARRGTGSKDRMLGDHWVRHLRIRDGERRLHGICNAARKIFIVPHYGRSLDRDGAATKAFEPSLFVWATVMIRPAQDRAIVDADRKALAFDFRPIARSRRDRHQAMSAHLRRARQTRDFGAPRTGPISTQQQIWQGSSKEG